MTRRDVLTSAAHVIADWPQLWRPLLELHVAGPDGLCRCCRSTNRAAPVWPCNVAVLALTARRLADAIE